MRKQQNKICQRPFNLGMFITRVRELIKTSFVKPEWFEKAASKSAECSQYNLGQIYYYGQGVNCELSKG